MKKRRLLPFAGIALLLLSMALAACSSDVVPPPQGNPPGIAEEIIILQIGAATDGNISHSFVELYNMTDDPINLSGYSIQYAAGLGTPGLVGATATEDGPWSKIDLAGTIAPKSSFLILGNKGTATAPALLISAGYGDMNEDFDLSNRAVKVALMSNTVLLDMQNPFDADGLGNAADGYVDMVGAVNTPGTDYINGYETSPISDLNKQAGQRRKSLGDTNDNLADFERATYAGAEPVEFERMRPKNTDYGEWDPMAAPEEPGEPGEPDPDPMFDPDPLAGKLLILQAYGGSSSGAVSHSFVELYNTTTSPISLNGFTLQYASGTRGLPLADADGDWKKIDLSGETISAGSSFLILGQKQNAAARLLIGDDYGDVNDPEMVLGNRSFKVALLHNDELLSVQNPWGGTKMRVEGYVDMAGSANDPGNPTNPDQILGFETAPARNSASEAIRRKNLVDTDDNSADFASVRYNNDTSASVKDWELDHYSPHNSKTDGAWDPMDFPEPPEPPEGSEDIVILQIGAATDGNISHSFVELYNLTSAPINLSGYSIQYAAGLGTPGLVGATATEDGPWSKIDLTGTIAPKSSFLILGNKGTMAAPALLISAGYGDMNEDFDLSNRAVKVALMSNTDLLDMQNPFDADGLGTAADGYVDMVGAVNTAGTDFINGYEGSPISDLNKQAGQRRKNLSDTNDNLADFERATYLGAGPVEFERMRPKNTAYGAWDPMADPVIPVEPPEGSNKLMILQIGAATDGNISHSFVELYNLTSAPINLSGYSIQYAAGLGTPGLVGATETEDGPWSKIDLTGTIAPNSSFLILGNKGTATAPALLISDSYGDMNEDFDLSNRAVKVALMSNTDLLDMQNPFDADGLGTAADGYVDMVGAVNTAGEDFINGYEGSPISDLNKQAGQRRKTLYDTDVNSTDFARATYAGASTEAIERMRPKNTSYGAWNPITGDKL